MKNTKKPRPAKAPALPYSPHVCITDGIGGCLHCPLLENNRIHTMPTTSAEVTAYEARRLGEPYIEEDGA